MKTSTILFVVLMAPTIAFSQTYRGFNLTENGDYVFKANGPNQEKSQAQVAVDKAIEMKANHIIINVRAQMVGPRSSNITLVTGAGKPISKEAREIRSLVKYAKSQGLTVGLRPIFFVVGPQGEFPYKDSTGKVWWHGNIQPSNPNLWFEQFQQYVDRYLSIAHRSGVDTFTLGAELYSMTVGIEDQWKEFPYGFPGRWLELLRYAKSKYPNMKYSYDINFTDDVESASGLTRGGGEFERWRYRLVDLAHPTDAEEKIIWQNLVSFWKELDFIGIDMYRSFAFRGENIPSDSKDLLSLLVQRSQTYADQLDQGLFDIEGVTLQEKKIVLKEVGYRSVEDAFVEPFGYATSQGQLDIEDQALSYKALLVGFWDPSFPWFDGVSFWDISLTPELHGSNDKGFSPYGKGQTMDVIKDYFTR